MRTPIVRSIDDTPLLKIRLFWLLMLMASSPLLAQVPIGIATGGLPAPGQTYPAATATTYPRVSAGLLVGFSALPGLDVALQPSEEFVLRLSYQHFKLNFDNVVIDPASFGYVEGPKLLVNGGVFLSTVNLTIGYLPFEVPWFQMVAGLSLGLNNSIGGRFELLEPLQVNDLELSPEEVGFVQGTYYTDLPFYPYLGIGFGRLVPRRYFSLSVDLGTFYRPAPRFELESSKLIEDNEVNESVLEENFMKWRWQPTLNVRLGYRIM